MNCKDNIVYLHGVDSTRMKGKILVLYDRRDKEAQVEGRVTKVSGNIQNEEIKVEANHTATPEVENHLHRDQQRLVYSIEATHTSTDIAMQYIYCICFNFRGVELLQFASF